jgi:predicted dienelactone hydrolase
MMRLGLKSSSFVLSLALLAAPGCSDDGDTGQAAETGGNGSTSEDGTGTSNTPDPTTSASGDTSGAADETSTGDAPEGPQPSGPGNAIDPSVAGPYPVGVMTIEFVDPTRDGGRPLVTEIWYPATDEAIGMDTVTYEIPDIFRQDALDILGNDLTSQLVTNAVRDAPMRSDDGPYPVVFFSHGSGGMRMQSTYYTVDMASHGYVVVSPDHIGNTLSDLIVTGDFVTEDLLASLGNRPQDLSFIREELELLEPSDPLAEIMDFESVGVTGHSFGALTSLRWMAQGGDVDAVVAQTPVGMELAWVGISAPLSDFDTPIQLQVAGNDLTLPPPEHSDTVWDAASEPRARMTLADAGHFTFSDMCSLDPADITIIEMFGVSDALDDGCLETNTDPAVAGAAIRHFGIGFFNIYLRGSTPTLDLLTQEAGEALAGDILEWEAEL